MEQDKEKQCRQAKMKALSILKYRDRTEAELYLKLKQARYDEEAVKVAVEYVKSYHYIDDQRYAKNYIGFRKETKSMKQMQMELIQKGIERDCIQEIMEEENITDGISLDKAIKKKTKLDIEQLSREEKQKIGAFLYRKGFRQEDIRKALKM